MCHDSVDRNALHCNICSPVDHGQKRYGLIMAGVTPIKPMLLIAVDSPKAVYIPAKPLMQPVKVSAATPDLGSAQPDQVLPDPVIPGGALFHVAGHGANVREGSGTTFAVLDILAAGEQVLVVNDPQPVAGWSKIKIEGDGVEGYIATRLLGQ